MNFKSKNNERFYIVYLLIIRVCLIENIEYLHDLIICIVLDNNYK
jgi:hypothetical protein